MVFLLVGAGAYAFIGIAEEPAFQLEGDHTLGADESFTGPNGTTYTVSSLSESSATFRWHVPASTYTASWANGSTVSYENDSYNVSIPDVESPQNFTLVEVQDVPALLQNDTAVENQTITRADGRRHVVYAENGTTVPLSEYLPDAQTVTFRPGETFQYQGNTTNVSTLTAGAATLTWEAPRNITRDVDEGGNATLDEPYTAHFPAEESVVVLTTDYEAYQQEVREQTYYTERINGLWGVAITSGIAATLLLAMAYLPSRY